MNDTPGPTLPQIEGVPSPTPTAPPAASSEPAPAPAAPATAPPTQRHQPTFSAGTVATEVEDFDDDEEAAVHDQLPTVEEIRNQAAMSLARAESVRNVGGGSGRRREAGSRNWRLIGGIIACLLLIGAIVGLSVGISENRKNAARNSRPRESRIIAVKQWLNDNDVSDWLRLEDDTTPQFRAATWIADVDERFVPLQDAQEFIERYSLAVLYFALGGLNWSFQWNFLSQKETCGWNELVRATDGREFRLGASCNNEGEINTIHIPQSRLKGQLPPELGHLSSMVFLALNHNEISGSIPAEVANMNDIDYFAVHWNSIEGPLPTFLSRLTKLRVLGLGNNKFEGKIPTEYATLTNLLTLGLDDNLLTGTLESLRPMTKMERLYLEDNAFEQDVATLFFDKMTALEEADMSDNIFGGDLPQYFFEFDKIEVLDFHGNKLERLPTTIPPSSTLKFMAFHNNQIFGPMPSMNGYPDLTHLDLSTNLFTGDIPVHYAQMTSLRYLFLASNPSMSSGIIPDWSQLTNLRDLSVKKTNRVGIIPEFLSTLEDLILLDLDDNSLTGSIPSSLGNLRNLAFLLLNRNEGITGEVPDAVQNLPLLQILLVDRTSVSGTLDTLCGRSRKPQIVGSDCDGLQFEVKCECCTVCCADDEENEQCKDQVYLGQLDPVWENSYQRNFYQFAPSVIFG